MNGGSTPKEVFSRKGAKAQRRNLLNFASLRETSFNEYMRLSTTVAWTFATRLLMICNSVVAGIIVARWLGAGGVGQLAVINVAVATIVQLGSFGLPSSNTYFIAQDQARFRSAAINSFLFAFVVGTLLAIALITSASIKPDWFGFVSPNLIRIAALSIPFQLITLIG